MAPSPSTYRTSEAEETLSGLVERIVFRNAENGFSVLRVKAEGRREPVTVVGAIGQVQPGEFLRAIGRWQTDPSFGFQFRADSLTALPPSTAEGMEAYLGSGLIKGVGPAMARKLVAAFGERVFDVIERTPHRLREIEGVGRGLAQRIVEAWRDQRAVRDIMVFLHGHGLSPLRAARIHEAYGKKAIDVVTDDPYRLARDIRGIGFQAADELAARLGLERNGAPRLRAGLVHSLTEAQDDGHCALPRGTLITNAAALLGVSEAEIEPVLAEEIAKGRLVAAPIRGTACVYLPALAEAEAEIAAGLIARAEGAPEPAITDPKRRIEAAELEVGHALAPGQKDALELALGARLVVITGGPGTGKTTLVNALLAALPDEVDVKLAAPTGRAARRLAESTGKEARTLHRLLEADPGRGFGRGPDRPIVCDLLVIDEVSMVDMPLMQALLRALPDEAALVLVGDVDQLPSIGPGQVLKDIIDSRVCPVVALTEIFRQAAQSRIVTSAHSINHGHMPDLSRPDDALSDFYAIRAEDPDDAAAKVLELVAERVPARFGVDALRDIQVLCPTNRGRTGARALNGELQAALNPPRGPRLERHGVVYAEGDKIMQTVNDYDREVNNGDLGIVTRIDPAERTLTALFDGRSQTYPYDGLDALAPAYAVTVHKAQGSEYPVVILPLLMQHGRMLRRNLVYTAITRAKRLVVLVAEPRALELAVTGRPNPERWSGLRERLQATASHAPVSDTQGET